ncbi:DUF6452 family protein [Flavobacteriaceae bacterium]|jgi:hypothetical protein|nr:DUF6452 family protein [Flavobacteriaceae bacterium]
MKKVSVLFLVISVFLSCEKDDICSSDTGTTPQLILRFYDIANQEETKAVPNLLVYGVNSLNEIVLFDGIGLLATNTDSIAIPLQTSDNFTRFVLHRDLEDGDFETGNIDIIIANYEREDVYVSRACGYKQIFNNLGIDLEPDPSNWVINSEILSTTINNENEAHVKIFH